MDSCAYCRAAVRTHIRYSLWSWLPSSDSMRRLGCFHRLIVQRNVPLKKFTTLKVGGPADYFFSIEKESDLENAFVFIKENNLPFLVIGGGSNMLVGDEGFSGAVLLMNMKGVEFKEDGEKMFVTALAGEDWDNFVDVVVKRGLYGLENLSSIPGTVGAAPIQNIGAYGVEVSECIDSVSVFDTEKCTQKIFSNKECDFSYRNSLFKSSIGKKFIVTSVSFLLSKDGKLNTDYKDVNEYFALTKEIPTLASVRLAITNIRAKKMPDWKKVGTAGSFFKNPIVDKEVFKELRQKWPLIPGFEQKDGNFKIQIAWVLDNILHLKGYREGNVGLHEKQPLVLVNYGNANAKEIFSFAEKISDLVKKEIGIVLEKEVVTIF